MEIIKKKRSLFFYVLSFFIPAAIILVALAGLEVTPFGDKSLVISDGNALYINYLGYVARAVKGQENVLFSFEKGLGGNMMGSWGWFLINPFFPLFAFFDITQYMTAYTWVSLLNFSLCGLTMYILLADNYGQKLSNLIFSTAYALNGFLVANVFQMNFFTGVPTLPLMVLGLRRILHNKNPLIYILSLAYSLLTNFYFGFMLCTASFLLFTVFYASDWRRIENRKAVAAKYILSSILSGALSSFIWLPALLSLRGGRLDQSIVYAISFRENMPFLEMAAKLFSGANTVAELNNGLPNIFVGILPVALLILYFMNESITSREKAASAVLLAFYLISFYIPALNLIMHGGTTTNWFNYRDSFVFCFLLLMVAAEQWQHISETPKKHFKRVALILVLGILIIFSKSYEFVLGGEVLLDLILLCLMYLAYRMYKSNPKKNPKSAMELVVLILVCVNLYVNYEISTKNIMIWSKDVPSYQETIIPVSVLVDAAKASDRDFYRMEVGEQRSGTPGNDPMLYGYYGVGHGGSDDRDFVRGALSKLGVRRLDMRNSYGKGIPAATDTLLGIKYLISKEDLMEEKGYEKLVTIEDWSLYRNPDVLPAAMLVNDAVSEVETEYTDVFDNLNRAWSAISGQDGLLFTEEDGITFSSYNVTDPMTISKEEAEEKIASRESSILGQGSIEVKESGEQSKNKTLEEVNEGILKNPPEDINYIKYSWIANQDGPVYSYNRSGVVDDQGAAIPALNYEGYYHKGEVITSYIPIESGLVTAPVIEDVAGRFRAAYADNGALHELANIVKNRPCSIEKVRDSHLRGVFTAEAGQKLLFSIPFDEGWTCFVDGKEAEIKKVLGVFMAVDAPEGTHNYEMKFFPVGMKTGIVVSMVAIVALLVLLAFDRGIRGKILHPIEKKEFGGKPRTEGASAKQDILNLYTVERNDFKHYVGKDWLAALLVTALVSAICVGLLTSGVKEWGDDSAAYIAEGIAIANGSFEQQQSINYFYHPTPLPKEALNGKLTYAWGYPLLQAIVFKLVGFDYDSIICYKIPVLLSLALTGGVLVLFFRRRFSLIASACLAFIFCMSGELVEKPNILYSDLPFLFLSMLTLLMMEVFAQRVENNKSLLWIGSMVGIVMWMTYETRLVGDVVCAISILGYLITMVNKKVPLKKALWVLLSCTVMVSMILISEQFWLAPATKNISDLFEKSTINTFQYYSSSIMEYYSTLFGPRLPLLGYIIFLASALGFFAKGFKKNLHFSIFILGTFFVLLNLPYIQGMRYLYHVLPLILMYMAYGFQIMAELLFRGITTLTDNDNIQNVRHFSSLVTTTLLCVIIVFTAVFPIRNAMDNIKHWGEKSPYDVYSREAIEIYQYIRDEVPDDKIVSFAKPRALFLNTGHLSFRPGVNGHTLEDADYYLYTKFRFPDYEQPNLDVLKKEVLVENDIFVLYRLL